MKRKRRESQQEKEETMTREIMNRIRVMTMIVMVIVLAMETANFIVSMNYPAILILLVAVGMAACLLFRLTEE